MNLKALKDGKWTPSIQGDIARALRQADSRKRFVELLGQNRIDVVFRENERGRIYGVTFIDHNRREVFNGSRMGKEFSANVFNDYFKMVGRHTRKGTGWTFRYRTLATSSLQGGTGKCARTGGGYPFHGNQSAGLRGGGFRTPYEEKEESQA